MSKKEGSPARRDRAFNKLQINIDLKDNKDFHIKNEYFLLNFECKNCIIQLYREMTNNAKIALNSAKFALSYASVDTFYITKNNSGIKDRVKVCYLG